MRHLIIFFFFLALSSCGESNSSSQDAGIDAELDMNHDLVDVEDVSLMDAEEADSADRDEEKRSLTGVRFLTEIRPGDLIGLGWNDEFSQYFPTYVRDDGNWLEQFNFTGATTNLAPVYWKGRVMVFASSETGSSIQQYEWEDGLALKRSFSVTSIATPLNLIPYGDTLVLVTGNEVIFIEEGLLDFQITKRLSRRTWTQSYPLNRTESALEKSYIFEDILYEVTHPETGKVVVSAWDLKATEENLFLGESGSADGTAMRVVFSDSNRRIYTQGGTDVAVFSMEPLPEVMSTWDMATELELTSIQLVASQDWLILSTNRIGGSHVGLTALDPTMDEPVCLGQIRPFPITESNLSTRVELVTNERVYVRVDSPQPWPLLPIQSYTLDEIILDPCPE